MNYKVHTQSRRQQLTLSSYIINLQYSTVMDFLLNLSGDIRRNSYLISRGERSLTVAPTRPFYGEQKNEYMCGVSRMLILPFHSPSKPAFTTFTNFEPMNATSSKSVKVLRCHKPNNNLCVSLWPTTMSTL